MASTEERKEAKKKNTRKSINFLIALINHLDDKVVFPGVEYNMTTTSAKMTEFINAHYNPGEDDKTYDAIYNLRITRHFDDGHRSDPLYVILVGKNMGWTFHPYSIIVQDKQGAIISATPYEDSNGVTLASTIASVLQRLLCS